ncbi:extracellular matrix regulator RemB [Acidaminobacterium chupaoyuni]
MYLHLGRDIAVSRKSIIGIFDFDTSTYGKRTREFLHRAEIEGRVVSVSDEIPKSAVVCVENGRTTVYISQISSQTLLKRAGGEPLPGSVI